MKLHSHYDNLKVSRDAPPEVIRAAYKSLAQKYHPDRNPDPKAARIFTMINAAYEVLSDPRQRAEHDRWIALKELQAAEEAVRREAPPPPPRPEPRPEPPPAPKPPPPRQQGRQPTPMVLKPPAILLLCMLLPLAAVLVKSNNASSLSASRYEPPVSNYTPVPESPRAQENAPESTPAVVSPGQPPIHQPALTNPAVTEELSAYARPATGPFGYAWPLRAAYLTGTAVGATGGHSEVSIDNTRGGHDVHAKLVHVGALPGSYGLREFLIPAGQSFKLDNLATGDYELRYMQLDDGETFSTDGMSLQERETSEGIRYNRVKITLFNVRNGNMRPIPIPRSAF